MGIFRKKHESKKTRKHAFDQESDQEKTKKRIRSKKERKNALEQESVQEKKKLSFFLAFFYEFSPQYTYPQKKPGTGELRQEVRVIPDKQVQGAQVHVQGVQLQVQEVPKSLSDSAPRLILAPHLKTLAPHLILRSPMLAE